MAAALQNLGRQRNDLHEAPLAQLARHRAEHARADRLVLVVDEHGGVAVEADVAAVAAALLLAGANDHGLYDLALLHRAVRRRFLHRRRDDVAEARVAAGRAADRVDHGNLPRPRIVGDVENRAHLDHGGSPVSSCVRLDRRLRHDLRDDPALAAAERARLGDAHRVARFGLVALVVGDELRGAALDLAVDPVAHLALDRDHHRFFHLVADHRAGQLCLDAHVCYLLPPLAENRLDPRQVAAQRAQLGRRLELTHRLLDAEPEQLIVEVLLARLQILDAQFANLTNLHDADSWPNRAANLVLIGSLAAASCIARLASVSLTPSISKRMRPGRTTHTH